MIVPIGLAGVGVLALILAGIVIRIDHRPGGRIGPWTGRDNEPHREPYR